MQIKIKHMNLFVCAFLSLSMFAAQSSAAPITVSASGTIYSGTDVYGTFSNGVANTDLTGGAFKQRITVDPTQFQNQASWPSGIDSSGMLLGGIATDTVTINGVSKTYMFDLSKFNDGQSFLNGLLTMSGSGIDEVGQYLTGSIADGTVVFGQQFVYSYVNAFGVGTNFDQNWSYNVQENDTQWAQFGVAGSQDDAYFYADVASMSLNTGSEVPEPLTPLLFMSGLMALALVRRKARY